MRSISSYLLLLFTFCAVAHALHAQVDPQAGQILMGSLKAFGGDAIRDVTLTGTATRIPSSNSDNVNITLKAIASGANQISYAMADGPLVETRVLDNNGSWRGNWSGPTGTRHSLAFHNMMTEPTWFFPELALYRALKPISAVSVTYVGKETFQDTAVEHLRFVSNSITSPQNQTWGQTELYLDGTTLLPFAMTYNDHPDNNVLLNIPVTILYSNYVQLGDAMLPTHVLQFRNNAVFIDLKIQSAQVNAGITVDLPQ